MDFIIFLILIFIHGLFAEEIHLPDGRLFNVLKPEDFPYIFDEYPLSLERLYVLTHEHSNAALSCPKGYAMLEMSQNLVANDSYVLPKGVAKHHTASLMSSKGPDRTVSPPCPVIYGCLGYQACLFEFNLHFCPYLPSLIGQSVLLNIVCFRDETEVVPLKFKKKKHFVLHIYPKHQPLHEQTKLGHLELPEDEVFGRQCSSPQTAKETEGFFGNCSQNPPSVKVTTQQLWPLLGKTLSASCRNHLFQVYCAFQYDREGFCLPPMYHNKNNKTTEVFSSSALPAASYQQNCNVRADNLTKPDALLKPARLAFMIMVNSGYQQAMDLISAIYREESLYVIHVNKQDPDLRQELNQLISQSSFPSHNIYILPEERSFISPLSSYENVRAQLEGFSELLCFDSWDFVINLSDDDIPLRSTDDLAAALSPYLGFSFLSLPQRPDKDEEKESTLNDSAFSACDGFIYKVTSKKPASKLEVFRTSSNGAFSREFIAYLINETMRSKTLNDHQFYLQTDAFPDESYISTVLMNSPHRESAYFSSIFSTKDIEAGNYLSDFYICKNQSQLKCSGIEELITLSHSSFFVRPLTQPPPDIRAFTLSLAKGNYYGLLEKYLSPILQRLIVEDAIERFSAKAKLPSELQLKSIFKFHITPSLVPQDPCCESDLLPGYSEVTDFTYWIVANLFNRTSGKYIEARLLLESTVQNRFCFSDGDLRMAFISPWIGHLDPSDRQFSRFTPEIVMPLPYGPAFTNDVLVNLVFSTAVINSKCRSDHKGNPILSPMNTKNFKDFIIVNLRLISPNYEEKCAANILLNWEYEKMKPTSSQQKKSANVKSFIMHCKNMEPGQWTLELREIEPVKSDVYRFPLYLMDFERSSDLASHLKEIVHLWNLKRFLLLTNEISFELFEPEISDENLDKTPKKKLSDSQKSENIKRKDRTGDSEFHQWFICTGGFASTFSVCLLLVLVYYRKSRFHQNLVWVFMLSLILIVLLQIALYVTLCGQ